jgi:ABC-type phosphate transport system permease subunit
MLMQNKTKRTQGWMGIRRGHRAHPAEWLAEKFIFLVSLTAIVMVFLIFAFIMREALPLFLGKMNSALVQPVIAPADLDKIPRARLQEYLGLSNEELARMDKDTLRSLMEVK